MPANKKSGWVNPDAPKKQTEAARSRLSRAPKHTGDRPCAICAPDRLAEAEQISELFDHEESEESVDHSALEERPMHVHLQSHTPNASYYAFAVIR